MPESHSSDWTSFVNWKRKFIVGASPTFGPILEDNMKSEIVKIELTKEQYEQLISELYSLYGYHWNSDKVHADDCGSKVIDIIQSQVQS